MHLNELEAQLVPFLLFLLLSRVNITTLLCRQLCTKKLLLHF